MLATKADIKKEADNDMPKRYVQCINDMVGQRSPYAAG
jgi:hypothetical protein